MKTFAKIIGYGLVVLLLAAVVGFAYKFTNGFNEDLKTFYIEYNGKQILTTENKMTFKKEAVHRFDVKYTFDKDDAEPKGYKVKIIPNKTRDFDYTVDGEKYLFSKAGDLTAAFEPIMHDIFFELYLPESLSFSEILKKANNGNSVSVPSDALTNNPYPFKLQISSYNEKVKYNIDFTFEDNGSSGSGQPSGGNTNTPSTPTQPDTPPVQIREYNIGYLVGGDGTNLTNLSIDGPSSAKADETIIFHINIYDKDYIISGFYIYAFGVSEKPEVIEVNGAYQFVMPTCNVDVRIDLEYVAPTPEVPQYGIECDSLGWASMAVVNMNCPDRAAADETVTFTANVKSEYASEYRISSITVQFGSGDAYIEDLQPVNGVYTFTMPDAATMGEEVNEGYITLLFYIIPIDM